MSARIKLSWGPGDTQSQRDRIGKALDLKATSTKHRCGNLQEIEEMPAEKK